MARRAGRVEDLRSKSLQPLQSRGCNTPQSAALTAPLKGEPKGVWNAKKDRDGLAVPVLCYLALSCQNATALAAATLRESTPWDMGIITV